MGIRLIFLNLRDVTKIIRLYMLIGLCVQVIIFQEITPSYRPYPKPTQVDR